MKNGKRIFVNQIGFAPDAVKTVCFFCDGSVPADFFVNDESGRCVWSGKFGVPIEDAFSGGTVASGDFSAFSGEGIFTVTAAGSTSFPFRIGSGLYDGLLFSVLDYFRLSRCGEDVLDPVFGHAACHTKNALVYGTEACIDVHGGWHDAGDYGRYVVAGAKAVMDLLDAFDSCGSGFSRFDILSEVRFELEWMLRMQRSDGAVYHKVSCFHFCGFIMPQDEDDELVVSPVSTAATADFAGCAAAASKYFALSDGEFAARLLSAAKLAQSYLDSHDDEIYSNPPELKTGEYGDRNVADERYFALCALFSATGDGCYLQKALALRAENLKESFGWGNVAGYGTEILLKSKDSLPDSVVSELADAVVSVAEKLLSAAARNGFAVALEKVFWGSNGCVCDNAHVFMLAFSLTGRKEFRIAASRQLDYILGCNPLGICYVTGAGSCCPEHTHHRPSGALGKSMPGMLAGGPASGMHDAAAKKHLEGVPPLLSYIDDERSYSTNEVAIYWNSTLAALISALNFG